LKQKTKKTLQERSNFTEEIQGKPKLDDLPKIPKGEETNKKFLINQPFVDSNFKKRKGVIQTILQEEDEDFIDSKKIKIQHQDVNSTTNPNNLPECPYGEGCYRKNLNHFKEYFHFGQSLIGSPKSKEDQKSLHQEDEEKLKIKTELNSAEEKKNSKFLLSLDTTNDKEDQKNEKIVPKITSSTVSFEENKVSIHNSNPPLQKSSISEKKNYNLSTIKQSIVITPAINKSGGLNQIDLDQLKKELPLSQNKKSDKSLAFPSFSTSIFQFDVDKAAKIACKVIEEFLKKHEDPSINLILIEPNNSTVTRSFKKYYNLGDTRFQIKLGDITKMLSCGTPCRFIANECNWRLKSGGKGINESIFEAAGPSFELETKKRYPYPVLTGKSYPVPVPIDSVLYQKENVCCIIHCLGPNFNPKKPEFLKNDIEKGNVLLEQCYENLFECFYKLSL